MWALTTVWIFLIFFAPWWLAFLAAIPLVSYRYGWVPVIVGAVIMDVWYGVPIHALYDFSYIYTAVAILMSIVAVVLESRIVSDDA